MKTILYDALNIQQTHDSDKDFINFLKKIKSDSKLINVSIDIIKQNSLPFDRFFKNYGTEIGELGEWICQKKFCDIIPPFKEIKILKGKNKNEIKNIKNEIYSLYNKSNNKKSTNYDLLLKINEEFFTIEVKVIRQTEKNIKKDNNLFFKLWTSFEEKGKKSQINKFSTGTFQQVKAEYYDFIIGISIFRDKIDMYLIPTNDIKTGKLKIINQHAGAKTHKNGISVEGHLECNKLEEYKIKSFFSEQELMQIDKLQNYIKNENNN